MPAFRPLAAADLPRAAALSALAGWNQTAADWALFLREGEVRALDDGDPAALAATAAILPYGAEVAWIAMVLVRPDRRRQGLATALMRWAVAALAGVPCVGLDATPAGREVYRRLGFRDAWGFRRWALPAALPREPGVALRPLREADWPALLALDAAAFGAPRAALLRDFAARLPQAAWVAPDAADAPRGFILGREGLRAPQLGPLLAPDAATARALLAAALAALPPAAPGAPRALADLRDAAAGIAAWCAAHGATAQRPFTRMVLGRTTPPGDPAPLIALAGPEFG
ncbi:GNAT family N-acetyltransferase [Caldovatus aquaticus]|uniref:GNAT family N-acetyltransferase n=1 Tax=Caldovatus aquaticus TaxID=2865671 RepID=A0ABS7F2H2_9PROT|nr:GNAT family N-acetyltransferase [Caldovatus aquaticus]MBW8269805.1 GNAT family N-acetyltransferase [Caldovatus aquaticus]